MTSAAGMPCPVCKVVLVMSERQGVEIDYCPQCRGVWLDRGELDKIVERSSRENVRPPVMNDPRSTQGYEHDYRGHPEQHGYRKRKKSFLEELFD